MFTVTVGKKTYKVESVNTRALYEMQPAVEIWAKLVKITESAEKGEEAADAPTIKEAMDTLTIKEAMDTLIKWFCVFCGNQFTPDDILDNYPQDSIITDIGLALRAAQMKNTAALTAFPTTARLQKEKQESTPEKAARQTSRFRFMPTFLKREGRRTKST
jgi:predicted metal-dependent HD superfamily phosphohydrolase